MSAISSPLNRIRSGRYLYLALLGVLLVAVVIFMLASWQRLDFPYQIDYGEGPLLDRALSLQKGVSLRDIYAIPQDYPYHIVNYPPVFFMAVAPFIDPQNPVYTPGRILSLIAILIVAVNIFFIVKQLTNNRYAAVISALVLLANPIIAFWTPYFRVDFLGLAFCTTGLALLLYWHHTRTGLILTALLLVAGAYTRQTYIVCAPLAAFVYLLPIAPRRAFVLIGLIAGLGLSLLLLLIATIGWGFWFHVGQVYLWGGTPVSWEVLLRDKWNESIWLAGPLFLLLTLIFFWRYAKNYLFITAYALGSLVSLSAMVKAGSNFNYVIEPVVAFAMITGVFIDRALRGDFKRWQMGILFGLLMLQVTHAITITSSAFWVSDADQAAHASEWSSVAQAMVDADGQVLTDLATGLLAQQGYPILFEPFDFSQMARKGLWDQSGIVRDIEEQRFGLIVIQMAPEYIIRERWTDEMLQAFDTYYVESGSLPWCRIYRPRSTTTARHIFNLAR